jgi:transcriptional antiterminator RfaH
VTRWYVVHTRANAELRALENLRRQGFESFLPRYKRRRVHARKIEIVERPLFPRYLFVALDLAAAPWRSVLGTFGVADLIRRGDMPTPMPHGTVEALREDEAAHRHDQIHPAAGLRAGDPVRVLVGPFADLIGKFHALAESERVVVLLDLLGREVRARLPLRAIVAA